MILPAIHYETYTPGAVTRSSLLASAVSPREIKTSGRGPNEPITAVPRRQRLPADDLKLHVDIAARGVGIGADLFVCLLD